MDKYLMHCVELDSQNLTEALEADFEGCRNRPVAEVNHWRLFRFSLSGERKLTTETELQDVLCCSGQKITQSAQSSNAWSSCERGVGYFDEEIKLAVEVVSLPCIVAPAPGAEHRWGLVWIQTWEHCRFFRLSSWLSCSLKVYFHLDWMLSHFRNVSFSEWMSRFQNVVSFSEWRAILPLSIGGIFFFKKMFFTWLEIHIIFERHWFSLR